MPPEPAEKELVCPSCLHSERCGPLQMLERLQQLGMLKRAREPDVSLMIELLEASADRLRCSQCRHLGLTVRDPDEEAWQAARTCEACGQRIPPERLDVFPDTRTCVACADSAGDKRDSTEYCPKCGTIMTVRARNGNGLTRYEMFCPQCRR